jgi:threonine dehydrogenase-like Zn-dependent dehydrogenase
MSGIVEEVGYGVHTFKPGDEVIVSPASFCGQCEYCKSGLQHYCPNGAVIGGDGFDRVLPGGFDEFVRAPVQTLYMKPANISFQAAALTEPLAGSYKGLIAYTRLTVGEDVVIIGAGAMGLLLTQIACAAGAGSLILIDIADYKLEYARTCGATHTINSTKEDPKEAVARILPKGPDIVFEAAGALEAAELTFDLCRRGTRINMFGVIVPGTIPVSPARIHFSEIRMDASFSVTPRVMIKAIDLMEKRLVDTAKIITHQLPLADIQKALDTMGTIERIKVVVEP